MLKTNPKAVTVALLTHGDLLNHINSVLTAWLYSSVSGNSHASPGFIILDHILLWKYIALSQNISSGPPEHALAEPRSTCNGKFIFTCFILAGGISLWKKRHRARIKASAKLTNYIHKISGEVAIIDMCKFLGDFAEKNA